MAYRLAKRAETDLADIAYYIARESGSLETARRIVESITDRFHLLAANPYLGRARDDDLGPGRRPGRADPARRAAAGISRLYSASKGPSRNDDALLREFLPSLAAYSALSP